MSESSSPRPSSASESPTADGPSQGETASETAPSAPDHSDARYATQAAAAEPSPVAFEGGAGAPDHSGGGITPRREWLFMVLITFFSIAFVTVPAVLFTGIDLTASADSAGAPPTGSESAREIERLQLLQETRADALTKLSSYGTTEDGTFRIPVEDAMQITLAERDSTASGVMGRRLGPAATSDVTAPR